MARKIEGKDIGALDEIIEQLKKLLRLCKEVDVQIEKTKTAFKTISPKRNKWYNKIGKIFKKQ